MALNLILTGYYAGATITLNNRTFIRGRLSVEGPLSGLEGMIAYFGNAYNAYPEGSDELRKAQERDRANATANPKASRARQGDGSAGGMGKSPEGLSSDGGPAIAAPGDSAVVSGAQGDTGTTVSHDPAASFENAKASKLKSVLKALDPQNDEHWTQAGLPALMAIEQGLGGTGINRKEVEQALPGWNREKAIAEVTNPTA